MRPLHRLLFGCVVATLGTAMATERFRIDAAHTLPVFEVGHLGFSTQRGRFNQVEGEVVLDRQRGTGQVELRIDAASIDMGSAVWNERMRSEEFFDTARHPRLVFRAERLVFEDGKPVAAHGALTLLGVTRPLSLYLRNFNCGTNPVNQKALCGADLSATLRRSEFGMKAYLPAIADEIRIVAPVEAYRE